MIKDFFLTTIYQGRKFAFSAFFLLLSLSGAYAQFLEYGFGVGLQTYSGDLVKGLEGRSYRPALNVYHRMNLSSIVSLRYNLSYGKISGDDSPPIDALSVLRNYQFSTNLIEASISYEYFFLDYLNRHSSVKWSPYFSIGFGFFKLLNKQGSYQGFDNFQPVLPFGLGVKHLIGKRFAASFDLSLKKTFFDQLDGISDSDIKFLKEENPNFGNPNDTDWYSYVGVSFSYIIFKIPCPFKYIPNQSIL